MLKHYKWLVYIITNPYINFQHLIKCLAIYSSTAKQKTEKKNREENRKQEVAHLPGPPRPNLPFQQPRPTWTFVVFPQRGKHLAGGHADAADAARPRSCFSAFIRVSRRSL